MRKLDQFVVVCQGTKTIETAEENLSQKRRKENRSSRGLKNTLTPLTSPQPASFRSLRLTWLQPRVLWWRIGFCSRAGRLLEKELEGTNTSPSKCWRAVGIVAATVASLLWRSGGRRTALSSSVHWPALNRNSSLAADRTYRTVSADCNANTHTSVSYCASTKRSSTKHQVGLKAA